MNLDRAGALALARGVAGAFAGAVAEGRVQAEVGICPSLIYLDAISQALCEAGSSVHLGAQNGYVGEYGAFTGEVSMPMLAGVGVRWVLTGHSERRHVLGEKDDVVNAKTLAALKAGLSVILCIGETLDQRKAGETDRVNREQVERGLKGVSVEQMGRMVIAYEPVWAIGTGVTASAQDAQDAHAKVRGVVRGLYSEAVADGLRIQYGGSMKPENAAELMGQPDIDGGLIGGASLKVESFMAIVEAAG